MIIFSRKLSYDEYGKFQSVWMYTNIVNVIINFGLSAVILSTNLNFLFSFAKNNRKRVSLFYSILWVCVLTAFFFLAKNFDASLKYLLIAFIVIQNFTSVVETILIKRQGEKISFVINLIYSIFFFGWHLFILFTNYSLYSLVSGICILSVLKLIVMTLVSSKKELPAKAINEEHFLNHWIYLGLNDVVGVISKWMDKAFLLYLLTAADFAIFFNGSFEIPLFGLLISVTGSFLLIEISGNLHLSDKIIKLFRENFNALSAIVFPLFFFLFFFQKELFSFVFMDKYNTSLPVFAISIFILPLRINNYSAILQCFSEGKKILWGSVLDVVIAVILMMILYPIMHTEGIALAIVIATYCQVLYYLWHSAKTLHTSILKIVPFKKLILKFFGMLFLFACLFFLLSEASIKIKLLIAIPFTGIIILAGILPYIQFFLKKKVG
jgi:O-antigen/teichoic acid export membrane protein